MCLYAVRGAQRVCGTPVVAFVDSVLNQLVGLTNVLTKLQLLWYLYRPIWVSLLRRTLAVSLSAAPETEYARRRTLSCVLTRHCASDSETPSSLTVAQARLFNKIKHKTRSTEQQ